MATRPLSDRFLDWARKARIQAELSTDDCRKKRHEGRELAYTRAYEMTREVEKQLKAKIKAIESGGAKAYFRPANRKQAFSEIDECLKQMVECLESIDSASEVHADSLDSIAALVVQIERHVRRLRGRIGAGENSAEYVSPEEIAARCAELRPAKEHEAARKAGELSAGVVIMGSVMEHHGPKIGANKGYYRHADVRGDFVSQFACECGRKFRNKEAGKLHAAENGHKEMDE